MIEVKRYRKPDGYPTRYWGMYVDGELLAVVLYRKGRDGHRGSDPEHPCWKGGSDAA